MGSSPPSYRRSPSTRLSNPRERPRMNDAAPIEALPPQPLFHTNIVPVSVERHGGLRLNRDAGFGFCAGAATLPIGLGEFEAAANSYPILFTDSTPAAPIVLLGIRQGW